MPSARNIESVAELEAVFQRSPNVLVTDYRGLSVTELANLRTRLVRSQRGIQGRQEHSDPHRGEANRRQRFGAVPGGSDCPGLHFRRRDRRGEGTDRFRADLAHPHRQRWGGLPDGTRPEDVDSLAKLPGRPQLQADLVGAVQGPMAAVLGAINAALSGVARALDERVKQLEVEPAS